MHVEVENTIAVKHQPHAFVVYVGQFPGPISFRMVALCLCSWSLTLLRMT